VRRAELLGLQGEGGGAWTDVRATSLCGSLEFDTNFHGYGAWRNDEVPRGERRSPMPEAVFRARMESWMDTRPRNIDGSLVDYGQRFSELHARSVKGCTPARAWVLNVDADLLAQNASTMLSCKFAHPKQDNPAALRTATRALATAQLASTLCHGVETGCFSGLHAEHEASRVASADDFGLDEGEGRKRRKKEGVPDVHTYEYFVNDTYQRSRMFVYLLEYVRDRNSAHVTHGVRLWKLVLHPYHSDTELCAKVFEKANDVSRCIGGTHSSPVGVNTRACASVRNAAPDPVLGGRRPDGAFDGKQAWWHVKSAEDFRRAVRELSGQNRSGDSRLPTGVLPRRVDAGLPQTRGTSGGPLPFCMAYTRMECGFEQQVGGFSSASPEVVLNAKRPECLRQGLFADDGALKDVHPDQLDPDSYFDARGNFRLPPIVRDEGLMYVFTPSSRQISPLAATIPSSVGDARRATGRD
jgi:hypothetical protein